MKHIYILALFTFASFVQAQQPPHVVDLKSSEGTLLKASYFAAAKPGPGVLLFHQSNRDRKSWDAVARQLTAAGINVLTLDSRGHGESAGNTEAGICGDRRQTRHSLVSLSEFRISPAKRPLVVK